MSKVFIRTKKKGKGLLYSIYLEYNPPMINVNGDEIRYEFLNLEKFVTPKTDVQKKQNAMVDEIAEAIRCDRYIQFVRKDYASVLKDNREGDFLEYFRDNCNNYNIKFHCSYKHFKRFCQGKCSFKDITVSLCEKYGRHLLKDTAWMRKTQLNTNTAAAYLSAFLAIVDLAYRDGLIKDNIAAFVKRIKWNHDTSKEYLNENEIRSIEETSFPENPEVKLASLLAIYTGLRRSDIVNIKWKNLDLNTPDKACIHITICKTKSNINLPLSQSAFDLLTSIPRTGEFVFPNLTIECLQRWVPLLTSKAKIDKHITFHCFRHTFAMSLLNRGVDIYSISKLLGHKSVANTQVYAKLSNERLRDIVCKL